MKRLKSFSALILGMVMTVTLILALGEIKAKAAGLPEGLDTVSCKDGTIEYLALRLESSGNSGLAIDIQPIDANVKRNEVAYFYIRANGNNLKYLWQYKLKGETVWVDWTTKTTAEISVAYASYRNGMSLRCVITDKDGNKVTSSEAVLKYVG